jgi:hypothetical protein
MEEEKAYRSKITVEADLGRKGVEKTDVYIYQDDRLLETYFDKTFDDIKKIANDIKTLHKDAQVEICCIGEDCMGGLHRWSIDD